MEKIRILIIDDDVEGSLLLKEDLEQTGMYEVFEESRGLMALKAVRQYTPDIVLLDIIIPDLDGPSIAAQIEAAYLSPKPLIIFHSSIVFPGEAEKGTIGGYSFMSKDSSREDTRRILATLAA